MIHTISESFAIICISFEQLFKRKLHFLRWILILRWIYVFCLWFCTLEVFAFEMNISNRWWINCVEFGFHDHVINCVIFFSKGWMEMGKEGEIFFNRKKVENWKKRKIGQKTEKKLKIWKKWKIEQKTEKMKNSRKNKKMKRGRLIWISKTSIIREKMASIYKQFAYKVSKSRLVCR